MFKRVIVAGLLLAIAFANSPSARAQTPTDRALEQRGLADLFGKKHLKGGYYYSYETLDGDRQKLIWLPWGLTKETSNNSNKVFIFYKGYGLFKVNCLDAGNIDGVCIDGTQASDARLKIVAYSLLGDKQTLVAKSFDPLTVSAWGSPITSGDAKIYDFGNDYTGILVEEDDSRQGEERHDVSVFLCRNGHILDAGLIEKSYNNEGAQDGIRDTYYSVDSTVAFGEAALGMPKSIILTRKGTAPVGKERAIEPFNSIAVYTFDGEKYSGPPLPLGD